MSRRRRGMTLIELTVAVALLATAMTVTVRLVGWIAEERRATERRQRAAVEAANLLERVVERPWDDLSREVSLSPEARRQLPGGEARVEAVESSGMKRVRVEVRWRDKTGAFVTPVRLTTWVARRGGGR